MIYNHYLIRSIIVIIIILGVGYAPMDEFHALRNANPYAVKYLQ
jgi:hypothetical protein